MGKYHITATFGSNIIMSEANNIIFAQAKTSLLYGRCLNGDLR